MKLQILMLLFLIMICTASNIGEMKTRIKIKNMLCVLIRLEINCDRDVGAGAVDGVIDDRDAVTEEPGEEAGNEEAAGEDEEPAPLTKNYSINKNKQEARIFLSGSLSERDINLIKFSLKNKIVFT